MERGRAVGVSPSSLSAGLCSAAVNRSGHLSLHQFPCLEHGTGLFRPEPSVGMTELGHQAHPEPWPQLPDTGHILSSLPGDSFVSLALPLSEAKLQLSAPGTEPPVRPSSMNKELSSHRAREKLQAPPSLLRPLIWHPSFQVCGR